ncbi:hypothetical protein Ciccas_012383 [Cichlidogyrus casuarinus]|uniref:Ig-like domain-containing protein n=1 Tax=Cichlidogyrus casuarinus TaxID=1844966 RepID=A0ABD2PNN2_9PLAT
MLTCVVAAVQSDAIGIRVDGTAVPLTWLADYEDEQSPASSRAKERLCASVLDAFAKSNVQAYDCSSVRLSNAGNGTVSGSLTMFLPKVDKNGQPLDLAKTLATFRKKLATQAASGNISMSPDCFINDSFDDRLLLGETGENTQVVEYPNLPNDCTYIYTIQYRQTPQETPKNFDGGCKNKVLVDGLSKGTGYQYRLVSYLQEGGEPIFGPWSETRWTNRGCDTTCVMIILAVLGILLGLIGALIYCLMRRKRRRNKVEDINSVMSLDTVLRRKNILMSPAFERSYALRDSFRESRTGTINRGFHATANS